MPLGNVRLRLSSSQSLATGYYCASVRRRAEHSRDSKLSSEPSETPAPWNLELHGGAYEIAKRKIRESTGRKIANAHDSARAQGLADHQAFPSRFDNCLRHLLKRVDLEYRMPFRPESGVGRFMCYR